MLHSHEAEPPAAHVVRWMADTCRGAMYVHSRSIIPRDVASGRPSTTRGDQSWRGPSRAHGPELLGVTLLGLLPTMVAYRLDSQAEARKRGRERERGAVGVPDQARSSAARGARPCRSVAEHARRAAQGLLGELVVRLGATSACSRSGHAAGA